MASATYDNISYEVDGGKARIRLNRPDKRNALSIELVEELRDALWEADNDKSVHCIILSGAGPSFCAGYDLTPERNRKDDGVRRREGRGNAGNAVALLGHHRVAVPGRRLVRLGR